MADRIGRIPGAWSVALAALHSRTSTSEMISLYEGGAVSSGELLDAVWGHCYDKPALAVSIAQSLDQHSSENVRRIGRELRRLREEQIKDIELVRRTSPLKPGTRLILTGGYTAAYSSPWWLNGRENYLATFIAFAERRAGKMPVAMVKLDHEIEMTEGSGLRHKGRYALLKLLHVADWASSETITVHLVEALPEDVETFYLSHPFGTEIETHATYDVANEVTGGAGQP